jgi:hypothetical protein
MKQQHCWPVPLILFAVLCLVADLAEAGPSTVIDGRDWASRIPVAESGCNGKLRPFVHFSDKADSTFRLDKSTPH